MKSPSKIWTRQPRDWEKLLARALDDGLEKNGHGLCRIYFRADDVAVPGRAFLEMAHVFQNRKAPLALAVVPVWFTKGRRDALMRILGDSGSQWQWHQHGWRHVNHEPKGRKMEFGDFRSRASIARDLFRGRQRLEDLLGKRFSPLFTPPWNRMGHKSLEALVKQGFSGVSRTPGAKPASSADIQEIPVHLDLHTRKDSSPADGWKTLLQQIQEALSQPSCGVMLHHQRANEASWEFLDRFLEFLYQHPKAALVRMENANPQQGKPGRVARVPDSALLPNNKRP